MDREKRGEEDTGKGILFCGRRKGAQLHIERPGLEPMTFIRSTTLADRMINVKKTKKL